MLSALKKLTNKQDVITVPPDTAGHSMSGSLQKKFSRGVNYNMKIIIKGDRNVGKSCLLQRLQGGGFIEMYTPTEEIQVASIQWSFKATEDIVKVEVWDVVDRGKARQRHTGLKLSTNCQLPEQPALDAEFLDVYKGTHGVILMMDVTKSWTFDYVTRELPKIPTEIPVLILGNHCDMSHHRVISIGQATSLIETFGENRPAEVLYAESSMRNGFGLRLLHKFLGLPFLRLQKETLLALIERNKRDTEICGFEIAEFLKSDDADYNKFLNNLSNKRRQIAESNSRVPPPPLPLSTSSSTLSLQQHQQQQQQISSSSASSLSNSASNSSISSQLKIINGNNSGNGTAANNSMQSQEFRPTKSIIVGGGQPIIIPGQINVTQQIKRQQQQQQQQKSQNNSSTNKIGNITLPSGTALDIPQKDLVNALLQKSCDLKNSNNNNNNTKQSIDEQQRKIASLDEFCPDDGSILDKNFLDDMISTTTTNMSSAITSNHVESDSDNDDTADGGGNPMVAKFYDEPDYDNDDDDNDGNDDDNDNNLNSEKLKNLKIKNENNTKSIKTNPLAKHHQKRKSLINDEQLLISNSNSNNDDVVGIKRTSSMIEQLKLSSSPSSSSIPYEDNSDNNNSWLPEISVRQSPEGGEDTTVIPNNNQDLGIIKQQQQQQQQQHQNKSLKLQQQENDDKDKLMEQDYDNHHNTITSSSSSGTTEKRHKHKKHKKDKDKKDKDYDCKRDDDKKKKKKRSSTSSSSSSSKLINKQTDLEEFLNGTSADFSSRIDEAYEAI